MAVLLSFLLVGGLAWAVMQCIAEFLMIWPISGALGIYVGEFVDKELGIAVGATYWYVIQVLGHSTFVICLLTRTQVHICHVLCRPNRDSLSGGWLLGSC